MGNTIDEATSTRGDDDYLELVRAFPLRRLTTQEAYEEAKRVILRLSRDEEMDRAGTLDYVDVLVDLVADFEQRAGYTLETGDVTAADVVRHLLAERGQGVNALAGELGIPQSNLSDMLNGRRDWSKSMIVKLRDHFGLSADLFLK